MNDRKNAFDLLRVLLACSVIFSHTYLIWGYKPAEPLVLFSKGQTNFGEFGVMGFFALSGYLITASFQNTKNILAFASHRILRIFPGFWVCILICAFVFAPLLFCINGGHLADFGFGGSNSSISFVCRNFFLQINQWTVKDVLKFSAYKDAINGSLWSLFPELLCYGGTIIAGFFGLFTKNRALYLIVFMALLGYFAIDFGFTKQFGPTIIILSNAFKVYVSYLAGSVMYVYKDVFKFDAKGTIFALLFSLLLIKFGGFALVAPLLLAIVLINGFQLFQVRFKYDISYGLYIYSFPVQHVLYLLLGHKLPLIIDVLLAVSIAGILAFTSYLFIEKPAMRLRKKIDTFLANKVHPA